MTDVMTPDETLQADHDRALAYWVTRSRSYEPHRPARDASDIWFPAALAVIFTAAMAWAWSPVAQYGVEAFIYSALWTVFWVALVITAWIDCERA